MTKWPSILVCLVTLTLSTPPVLDKPVSVDGLVRLIEHIDVPALRDGRIDKVQAKEGDFVHRGDLLARLDDAEAQLTVKRTELEHQLAVEKANSEFALNSARLTQEVTNSELQRARQAKQASPSSVSLTELDRLRLESEKATNEITRFTEEKRFATLTAQTKSVELQLSRLALEEKRIISPLDGIVVQVHRREGEWVRVGEKVIRVVRIDRLRVEAYVNLHAALTSLEKSPVILEVDFPDTPTQEFSGEVVFIHPEADPVNGQIRIWAEIENRDRLLRPGQRGRLKVFPKKQVRAE